MDELALDTISPLNTRDTLKTVKKAEESLLSISKIFSISPRSRRASSRRDDAFGLRNSGRHPQEPWRLRAHG